MAHLKIEVQVTRILEYGDVNKAIDARIDRITGTTQLLEHAGSKPAENDLRRKLEVEKEKLFVYVREELQQAFEEGHKAGTLDAKTKHYGQSPE